MAAVSCSEVHVSVMKRTSKELSTIVSYRIHDLFLIDLAFINIALDMFEFSRLFSFLTRSQSGELDYVAQTHTRDICTKMHNDSMVCWDPACYN